MAYTLLMRVLVFALLAAALAACGVPAPTPLPTLTPTPSLTPTETAVWFPPTATPTVTPTFVRTPTPNLRPAQGSILVEDDFSSGEAWSLKTAPGASAAVANHHLTLALNMADGFLFTTRTEPVLGDFYAEITTSPNLCSPGGEYGVMVRTSFRLDYYRLAITCDGEAKLARVRRGSSQILIPAARFPMIPNAAPSSSRIGVWAKGSEIRFFVNDQYLFSATDKILNQGTFGVFVRSAGEEAISVNFSELVVREIDRE